MKIETFLSPELLALCVKRHELAIIHNNEGEARLKIILKLY